MPFTPLLQPPAPTSVVHPLGCVSGFYAGAPGFEEVTQLISHYFAQGDVLVSFHQNSGRPVLFEEQPQSVDGTELVTQEEFVEKEKRRRAVDGAKGAKFGKFKRRLNSVAEEGGTPRRSPHVACKNKNLGKRAAQAGAEDPRRK
ncbi:hypothetical protein ZWY2020_029691 [Hordeum vulgare]|nr:hypothetical protein ZWY2020_029691 [Hordeum vulgare]